MKEEEKLALIDADSLCFLCSKETLEESQNNIDDCIKNILAFVKVKKFVCFISEGKYFRHGIYPLYKSNRPPTELLWIRELKEYLKVKYKAISFDGAEADDLVAYYAFKLKNTVVCAIDKDLLKQIPGKHFNYHYKSWKYVETSEEEAIQFLWLQNIIGDGVDFIPGVKKGLGPVKAMKILEGATIDEYQLRVFNAYLNHYKEVGLAMHHMTLNFKLVYLLKTEEDFLLYFGKLPQIKEICCL